MVEEINREEGEEKKEKVGDFSAALGSPASDGRLEMKGGTARGRTFGPTKRSRKGGWTDEQDDILAKSVKQFGGKNWRKIAENIPDRTDVQCLHRWQKVLNPELIKGAWTKEEDDHIIELVAKYGPKNWSTIAQLVPGRIGKQCRERWHNHLNPAIRKDPWTQREEVILIRAHQIYGNKWAEIAKLLPGRADNSIKNHWNCSLKKRLDSFLSSGSLGEPYGLGSLDLNKHLVEPHGLSAFGLHKHLMKPHGFAALDLNRRLVKPHGLDALDLNKNLEEPRQVHLALQRTKSIASIDQKKPADSGLQPIPLEDGKHFSVKDLKISAQDSKSLRLEVKPVPAEDPKCVSGEQRIFMNTSNGRENGSPATCPNTLFFKGTSSISCTDNSDSTNISKDSHGPSTGNQFFPQFKFHRSSNGKTLQSSPKTIGQDFNSSYFSIGVMSQKFKDTNISSSPRTNLNCHDRYCDQNQITGGLQSPEDPEFGFLHHPSSQFKNNIEVDTNQPSSPCGYSTPPNLSLSLACVPSPETILRSRAKSFKNTPSIMRKRSWESAGKLFVEKSHSGSRSKSKRTAGSSNSSAMAVSIENILDTGCSGPCEREDSTSVISHRPLKGINPCGAKSIEKNLEADFEMEWVGSAC